MDRIKVMVRFRGMVMAKVRFMDKVLVYDKVMVMVRGIFKFMVRVKEWFSMIPILYTGALTPESRSWSRSFLLSSSWTWSRSGIDSWSWSWSWRGDIL